MAEICFNYQPEYGDPPEVIKEVLLQVDEMMLYQYLPIKIKGTGSFRAYQLEPRLRVFLPLIQAAIHDYNRDSYVYLTAKRLFCTPDNPGNRPGYHCDGFLSDDTNYIWYDCHPTVFCIQRYSNVLADHEQSMAAFEDQSLTENEVTYPTNTLLKLSPFVVHRTPSLTEGCMRTFVKISFSQHKYNLIGNSHNYRIPYNWKMYPRELVRNDPVYNEVDFYVPIED